MGSSEPVAPSTIHSAAPAMLYLDTSALVKLVSLELGSAELRAYLARDPGSVRFSSMLSHAELLRATSGHGPRAMAAAREVLASLQLVDVTRELLERAGTLNVGAGSSTSVGAGVGTSAGAITGTRLRTLDAIHVVTAGVAQERLRAVITYDERMSRAAEALGFTVVAPGRAGRVGGAGPL